MLRSRKIKDQLAAQVFREQKNIYIYIYIYIYFYIDIYISQMFTTKCFVLENYIRSTYPHVFSEGQDIFDL